MNAIFALPENSHLVEPEVPEYLQHLDNIEEQVPAMESHIEGIEVALESMERLIKLRAAFKRSGQPSKTKLKIGLLAIESIQRDTKIIPQGTAVEAFSEENIATEGFGSMISKIIEAIANTFKKLWEWIASFFQEQDKKKTIEEGNEKIKKAQEKIEKRKKEKESGENPLTPIKLVVKKNRPLRHWSASSVASHFSFPASISRACPVTPKNARFPWASKRSSSPSSNCSIVKPVIWCVISQRPLIWTKPMYVNASAIS